MTDHAQLAARLLNELATARAAIAASYLSLWRSGERSLRAAGDSDDETEASESPPPDQASDEP